VYVFVLTSKLNEVDTKTLLGHIKIRYIKVRKNYSANVIHNYAQIYAEGAYKNF
jgi:hypothetical protein